METRPNHSQCECCVHFRIEYAPALHARIPRCDVKRCNYEKKNKKKK